MSTVADEIVVVGRRTMSDWEIDAILQALSESGDGSGGGGYQDTGGGGIANIGDIPIIGDILEIFRITDDRVAAAERDEESTFDRSNPNLIDVLVYNNGLNRGATQWYYDTSNGDWWTDTNGQGTPDLLVRNLGGEWWADLDFNGSFETIVG